MNPLPTTPVILDRSKFITRYIQTRGIFKKLKEGSNYSENFERDIGSEAAPLFSVMLITYNHGKYIGQTLSSILNQKRNFEIEINVMDDASTDETQEIVLDYQSRYPGIINCYFNKKNIGHKATQLNTFRGFQSIRGKYFSLLEGDDYWTDVNKIKTQVEFLEANGEYVACAHNTLKIFDDGRPSEHFLPFKAFRRNRASMPDLVSMSGVYHLSSIVYRNIFGLNPPQCLADPFSCEVTINMVYGQYGDFYCIDKYMSAYRVHSGGEFSTRSAEDIWLFHIHGYRRFFLYLGCSYYGLFAAAIAKFSRYVLNTPKTGEVASLKSGTKLLFRSHIMLFAPMAIKEIIRCRLDGGGSKAYRLLNLVTPGSIKRTIVRIETFFPFVRRARLRWKG